MIAGTRNTMKQALLVLILCTTCTCLVVGETRHLAGISSEAVLEAEFYHDIDDTTLTVGTNHGCVLSSIEDSDVGGEVVCWGEVFEGQADPPNDVFVQLSAATSHTCGVTIDQEIKCWGQLPFDEEFLAKDFMQVSTSSSHTCGLHQTGVIECKGRMMHLMNHAEAPATPVVQIAAGDFVTCALDVDGEVHCWGRDVAGSTFEPPGEFVQVTSSDAYGTCAISAAGQVMCWGQFVNGRRRDAVYTLKGSFTQVTVGDDWVCAINELSRLQCAGGHDKVFKLPNMKVPTDKFLEISSSGRALCGILFDPPHRVKCWGPREVVSNVPGDVVPSV